VNAESVAVVVSAFMLGLGLGSLAGGWISARFPRRGILIFGLAELGIAIFGLFSLSLFRWVAAYTAGANLPSVVIFSFALLLVPTMLMGATLPILVEHLVRRSGLVGASVSRLYFVNTLGSALACYFCARFLMRELGQSGAVALAAVLNTIGRWTQPICTDAVRPMHPPQLPAAPSLAAGGASPIKLPMAMFLAGVSGFLALGLKSHGFAFSPWLRRIVLQLLLCCSRHSLAGIAAGAYLRKN